MGELFERIRAHWDHAGDLDRVRARLERKGLTTEGVDPYDLAVHDQLHVGQIAATSAFCQWVRPARGSLVADLGAGLGGSARFLAREYDCEVLAVELSPTLHKAGEELTRWTDQSRRVRHVCGDITDLDAQALFDLIWIQHVDMHIPEKARLYEACGRHLADGGRVVWHDWLRGTGTEPVYPVPWSDNGDLSFLVTVEEFERLLTGAGLVLTRYESVCDDTVEWLERSNQQLRTYLDKMAVEAGPRGLAPLKFLLEANLNLVHDIKDKRIVAFFGEAKAAR
jgi:SAM-dependent methyltransferase